MKNQPPPKAGIRLVLILSAFPSLAALPVEPRWREQCTVPEMTLQEMMIIRQMNCAEVENAILAFQSRESPCHGGEKLWTTDCLRNLTRRGAPPQSEWERRSRAALQLCDKSWTAFSNGTTGDLRQAAQFAVDAWGGVLMRGHDCCVLLAAPYCYAQTIDIFDFSIPLLVLLFVMLFICVSSKSCALWLRQMGKKAPEEPYHCTESLTGMPQNALDLEQKLMAIWGTSCLGGKGDYHKALPKSQEWGRAAASFYATMKLDFGFQADSVRNQFEHLISLWRSHAAMVTDLAIQDAYENRWRWSSGSWSDQTEPVRMDVNGNKALQRAAAEAEPELLKDALADLHRDLLEGLHRWRARLAACPELQVPSRRERQRRGLLAHADSESGKQLVEISVYLLVWGEAGNIRFMPEVVCFLTELALASEDVQMGGSLYQGSGTTKSGLFLAKIIRPIYNVIFEEWYLRVDVDAKTGKDKKVLRDKFHRFLPVDTANYDDWNELFCDPIRMSDQLRLEDGTRLFDLPHEHRFAALHRVNWRRALAANMVKTHREVHSLWGVFASIHRVILLHAVLFLALLLIAVENELPTMTSAVIGSKRSVRFAILGLIVPPYGFALLYARWEVTGAARRIQSCSAREICRLLYHTAWSLMWCVPAITYTIIRVFEHEQEQTEVQRNLFPILVIHYVVTAIGIGIGLFYPIWDSDAIWPLTRVSVLTQFSRFVFWGMVLSVKCVLAYFGLISKMLRSVSKLQLSQYSSSHVFAQAGWRGLLLNAPLSRDFVEECGIWGAAFFLFFADTLLWHILGCTILGVCYVFVQRRGRIRAFVCEDSVSKIQQRFPAKVLPFALQGPGGIPITFYSVWDRIVEFLRYEGKVTSREIGDLSYCAEASSNVQWKQLNMPLPGIDQGKREFRRPQLFRGTRMAENLLRKYTSQGQHGWPHNREAKWRLQALARGLGLPLPMPYRAPYVPGLSVLIPHYGESILAEKQLELLREPPHQEFYSIPLMDWLADKYKDEFDNFSEKMTSTQYVRGMTWPKAGTDWGKYNDENWEKLSYWASMRLQTLFRTVSGMMLYHNALQCHFEAQGDRRNKLGVIWDPSDAFTCVVAMQMYTFFNSMQYKHTNIMFKKFPKSMKVAYIDCEDLEDSAHPDCIHEDQKRRYYSCLIDASCPEDATGRREPKYKIEIPGYPILGDGKGDNQNTAVPFTRGTYVQCIDANQGAYFEQMLLLPNVLGEFRSKRPGDGGSKKIIGFPEHITSDFGSVGDFAASSELAFGTISQRSYSLLGARMHYGHPDIMNKEYMMQQGGVSKATKTLNLSEDIFAGMDFVLRGGGRTIKHREYFHLAKGRDLGFNTVLAFFSKLSSGAGEQLITRQTNRLGNLLPLPEFLSFYYAHMGHYLSQWSISWGLPLLTLIWLVVLLNGCEESNDLSIKCIIGSQSAASVMAEAWQYIYSGQLLILFLLAQMAPIFFEVWMEAGIVQSTVRLVKQILTLSPVMFIFQAKVIGFYTMNELKFGGATYVATGRGLPTERRPFLGVIGEQGELIPGGLYLDYARLTYYDGASLLFLMILVLVAGGTENTGPQLVGILVSLCLVTVSWLLAPFIFNPYQFRPSCWINDIKAWTRFFLEDGGMHWKKWFTANQLKPRRGFRATVLQIGFMMELWFVVTCFASLNARTAVVCQVSDTWRLYYWNLLSPPIFAPALLCILLGCCGALGNLCSERRSTSAPKFDETYSALGTPKEEETRSRCPQQCPLVLVSLLVALLTIAELAAPLVWVASLGWKKASMLALLLKIFWLRLSMGLAMTAIRSSCFERLGCLGRPLELWLDALCMFRDIVVSSIIFLALCPLVLLSGISEFICPTFSIHHLIIYRQPGHTDRENLDFDPILARMCFDEYETEEDTDDSDLSTPHD